MDMVVPDPRKRRNIEKAYAGAGQGRPASTSNGIITDGERYQKVVDIWTQTTQDVSSKAALYRKLETDKQKAPTSASARSS